jgi:hypothetical protein
MLQITIVDLQKGLLLMPSRNTKLDPQAARRLMLSRARVDGTLSLNMEVGGHVICGCNSNGKSKSKLSTQRGSNLSPTDVAHGKAGLINLLGVGSGSGLVVCVCALLLLSCWATRPHRATA